MAHLNKIFLLLLLLASPSLLMASPISGVRDVPGDKSHLKVYPEHNQADNANAISHSIEENDLRKMEEFWGIIYRKHSDVLDPGAQNLKEQRKQKEYLDHFLGSELRGYEVLKKNFAAIAEDSKRSSHLRYSINITSATTMSELVEILTSLGMPVMYTADTAGLVIKPQIVTHERARDLLKKVFSPMGVSVGYNRTSDKYMLYFIGAGR